MHRQREQMGISATTIGHALESYRARPTIMCTSNKNTKFQSRIGSWGMVIKAIISGHPSLIHTTHDLCWWPKLADLCLSTFLLFRGESSSTHQLGCRAGRSNCVLLFKSKNLEGDGGEANHLLFCPSKVDDPVWSTTAEAFWTLACCERGRVECLLNTNKTHLFAVPADEKGSPFGIPWALDKRS